MDQTTRNALTVGLARLADGDREAFHPVFEVLWPVLRRFAVRFLGHEADAEDAAQQALYKVLARAGEFDPSRDGLSWALAIAANECRTTRNRGRRRREQPEDALLVIPAPGPTPEEATLDRELAAALEAALGKLRPEDLATIRAALDGDRGGRSGVPATTYRKRLERAMARLRAAWGTSHES